LALVHVIHDVGRRHRRNDDGAVAVLVAILSVVLFGFGALVVDIGHAQMVRSQAQSTVDAASLAGVRVLANGGSTSDVLAAVQSYADENIGITPDAWAGCVDSAHLALLADTTRTDSCISTSGTDATTYQVRVKLPTQHVPATFGGLFGVSSIGISPVAKAQWGQTPPECGPCGPTLNENNGQPMQPVQSGPPVSGLPLAIRQMLPDPNPQPPDPPLPPGVVDSGCPGPGIYEGAANDVVVPIGTDCTLAPGLYVFDNAHLDVQGNLISYLVPDPANPTDLSLVLGVTLVFYGTGTLTAENGGSITPLRASLVTADTTANWVQGDAIPGVAIVIDQFDPTLVIRRQFSLGNNFNISGSIYALDPYATWFTNSGDCPPGDQPSCVVGAAGSPSVIATTATAFADNRIPTIGPPVDTGPTSSSSPYAVLVQ
jgi:Putative Flp pilus-assembly TadE/G-like